VGVGVRVAFSLFFSFFRFWDCIFCVVRSRREGVVYMHLFFLQG
jgi:hypothetical protein